MTKPIATLVALLLVPAALSAQQGSTVEIGSGIGASILTNGGTITHISAPGPAQGSVGLFGAQAPLYATVFFGKGVMVQPELSFNLLTGEGETLTMLAAAANFGYAFSGAARNSAYVAVSGAIQYVDTEFSDSDSEFGAGARVGYRVLVNEGFAVGFEAGYRRWFDSDLNEITIALRLGGIVSSP
jgi:hypothetical protein